MKIDTPQSFIMDCARKYAERHPEERVTIIQETKIPVNCSICSGGITEVEMRNDEGIWIGYSGKPMYCPACGRKIKD